MGKFGELIENLEIFRQNGIRYAINAASIVSIEIGFENFTTRYTIQPNQTAWQIEIIIQEEFVRRKTVEKFESFEECFEKVVDDIAKITQLFLDLSV